MDSMTGLDYEYKDGRSSLLSYPMLLKTFFYPWLSLHVFTSFLRLVKDHANDYALVRYYLYAFIGIWSVKLEQFKSESTFGFRFVTVTQTAMFKEYIFGQPLT
jgi:hypothetical protein